MSHTPGPWKIDHDDDIDLPNHVGISAETHSLLAQVVWKMDDDERSPSCEANARLIAAAPDLLEALKEMLEMWEDEPLYGADIASKAYAEIERLEAEVKEAAYANNEEAAWIYARDVGALYREATAKIKTLEAEVKELAEKNIRLAAEVKELAENQAANTAKQLNEIHGAVRKEMNDKTWIYTRDMGALYREATAKIETLEALINLNNSKHMEALNKYNTAVEENIRLNKVVNETTHANDDLIKRNLALVTENTRLAVELDNLALASHSDKDVVTRNDELRDQFACVALQGSLARMQSTGLEDFVAERAYEQADAMLKAREKKNA
jgi:hypothetical protein